MAENRQEMLVQSLADIAAEAWRFQGVFGRMLTKVEPHQAERYANQYAYFQKKVEASLEKAGLRMVSLEGQPFDPGMAVTPLNIDDFDTDDGLVIAQMIEPILMDGGSVRRTGTVLLKKVEE